MFTPTFGADGAAIGGGQTYTLGVVAGASGLIDTLSGQVVNLVMNGTTVEGRTAGSNLLVFTVTVAANGDVTLDQSRAVFHSPDTGPNQSISLSADNLVTLTATVTDKDGDTASATANIGQNLSFLDDAPTLGVIQNQQVNNNPAQTPAIGTLHFAAGADGAGSAMTITANVAGITSGGHALVTHQVGNVLTGYADVTGNGFTGDDTAVFTVTVNPAAGTSGQYVFDLIAPLDGTVVNTPIGGSTSFGSGPAPYQVVSATNVAIDPLAIITGWHTDASFNAANWYNGTNILPAGVTIASVNGSTSGWGVDNNNFTTGEFIRWDFGTPIDDFDGPGGYAPPSPALPEISYATFDLIGYSGGDTIQFVVHHTDGTTSHATITGAALALPVTLTAAPGKFIDWIDTYGLNAGSGKIDITAVGVLSSNHDNTIPFTLQLTDADGDPTSTVAFSVHVADTLVPLVPAPPIALDLNGDGVHFLAASAGVAFDYTGNGSLVGTAWIDPNDGLLAIDLNANGKVDNGSEIVFGNAAQTDLQGLAAQYDSNGDGKLSAADTAFAQFGVWQDANSNGVSDPGEFKSLGDMGITSISLIGDGVAYTAAGGDVVVAGSSTFTKSDGSTGIVADVSFAVTEQQRQAALPAELTAINAAATGLLAAMALDQANAAPWAQPEAAHNMALAPVAIVMASDADLQGETSTGQVQPLTAAVSGPAPLESGHADLAGSSHDRVELVQLAENGNALINSGADSQKSGLFDFSNSSHAAMDALLSVGTASAGQGTVTTQNLPVLAEAWSDATGNHVVDNIVEYFTSGSAAQPHSALPGSEFALQGLLNSSVNGSGTGTEMPHFTIMQMIDHDQLATVA